MYKREIDDLLQIKPNHILHNKRIYFHLVNVSVFIVLLFVCDINAYVYRSNIIHRKLVVPPILYSNDVEADDRLKKR